MAAEGKVFRHFLLISFVIGFSLLNLAGSQPPYQRPARHLHDAAFTSPPIHPFPHAVLAILSDEAGLIKLGDEIIQIMVSLEDHIATPASVSPTWSAFRDKGLSMKSHTALAAVPGPRMDLYLVDEHVPNKKGEAVASP
jgi:hypothetical protein